MATNANGAQVFSTPSRDRYHFPQSAQPSPGPPLKHSSSSTSTSSSTAHMHTTSTSASTSSLAAPASAPLTLESLLKQHASAPDPKTAALEQAIGERNNLSAQNTQLWKLIEKQRAGYSQILKELDRIRGERDGYKSKLSALTGTSIDKPARSSDRTNKTSFAEPSQPSKSRSTDSHQAKSSQSKQNSNDDALTPRGSQYPQLNSSRSHDPLAASGTDNDLQSNAGYPRPETPPRPPPASAPSAFSTPSNSRTPSRPSPSPLILPPRNQSPAIPSSAISINAENAPFSRLVQAQEDSNSSRSPYTNGVAQPPNGSRQTARKGASVDSSSPLVLSSTIGIGNGSATASVATPTPHNYPTTSAVPVTLSSQKGEKQNGTTIHSSSETPNRSTQFSPSPTTTTPQRSGPPRSNSLDVQPAFHNRLHLAPETRPYLSRDSRITLPDEARQYITNMADSPMASPQVDNFTSRSAASIAETASLSSDSEQKSEFLDLDEDDEDDEEIEQESEKYGKNNTGIRLTVQQEPNTPTNSSFSRSAQSLELPPDATPNRSRKDEQFGQEEFPVPTTSGANQSRQQSLQSEGYSTGKVSPPDSTRDASPAKQLQDQYSSNSGHQAQDQSNNVRAYNNAGKPSLGPHQDMKKSGSQSQQSPHAVSASFRALPLLPTDLPYTTIQVSHSFVRPNDRGKEVLSFIVSVNPGHGKPSWKVEKLYSDVITLDQRVRNSVGKGVGKKIVNLPEGKLWRDHAPARVDQRKAVLEQYLQSLIQLPVKSNDEVIAFFTSDIVRETKQPVMQIGHKEGYLTKRGKNFGGWKTRFFVLQGPVLEYYDCRGGQHLGSITITGAQIARQHKTEKTSTTDEENEYRHAFLIVEAKKGPGGSHPRHVLCAESDEERDAWVELLVRYYTGTYNEELIFNAPSGITAANNHSIAAVYAGSSPQPRASTSSIDSPVTPASRKPSRPPVLQEDYMRASSPSRSVDPSPIDRNGSGAFYESQIRRVASDRNGGLPSSLPDPSPLSSVLPIQSELNVTERAASELGHYPDMQGGPNSAQPRHKSPERHRTRDGVYEGRQTNFSSTNLSSAQPPPERAPSPEKPDLSKVKISGPMNGTPIPSGFKFGKEPAPEPAPSNAERREKAKSRGFWGFGKGNGPTATDKQPNFPPRAVFAIPLEESLDVAQICGLPAIVFRCIQYLEAKKADQEEGIYRLSGSSAVIKGLKDMFNSEGDVDLLASDEYWDPHAIAGLLKSFLRDLPSSILTREMHLRFLAVIDLLDPQERIKELSQLIAALPIANYTLLRALTAHLILIVQNAHINKMTMRNVGIVFSPTLGIPAGVFSLMLAEFNRVFNVDMDDDAVIQSDPSARLSEPMRRNSKRYSDSAADKLLGLSGRTLKAPAEEQQSDGDDYSVNDESAPETEGDGTVESSSSSPMPGSEPSSDIRVSPPDTPMASKMSKASHVAASRGLNVTVSHSERGNRHSKLIGLPVSPRPPASPARTQDT